MDFAFAPAIATGIDMVGMAIYRFIVPEGLSEYCSFSFHVAECSRSEK